MVNTGSYALRSSAHFGRQDPPTPPASKEDFAELYSVAADPLIWTQYPASDRYQEDVLRSSSTNSMQNRSVGQRFAQSEHPTLVPELLREEKRGGSVAKVAGYGLR